MAFEFITQPSPLKWYDSLALTYYNRYQYKHDLPYSDPVPLNQIPSFNWGREQTGNQIVFFRLFNCNTGALTDITDEIKAAGLRVEIGTNRDNIIYPSTVKMLGLSLTAGFYYCIMSDGVNTWTSERFNMMNPTELEPHLKITYCHGDPIDYGNSGDKLTYNDGFMNSIYLRSRIRRPSYKLETVGDARQSLILHSQKVAFKEYTFQVQAPEYVLDTLMAIQVHDKIILEDEGIRYNAYNFVMGDPDWKDGVGDVGVVECTFRANAILIQAASKNSCDLTPGSCLNVDRTSKAISVDGSTLYNNYQYEDSNGNTQSLSDGDFILRSPTGVLGDKLDLFQYDSSGPTYNGALSLPNQIAFNEANGQYYYYKDVSSGWVLPSITSWDDVTKTLIADSFQTTDVVNEVYAIVNGVEVFLGAFSTAELLAGVVLNSMPGQANQIIIRVGSPECGPFYDSIPFPVSVSLCSISIQGSYDQESDAVAGGIAADEYWETTVANIYGMPAGIVFQYMATALYNGDSAAILNGLQPGQCYAIALSNTSGVPAGVVTVLSPSVTYGDDSAAGSGGVAIGEAYSLSAGNSYGLLANIQKIRKS